MEPQKKVKLIVSVSILIAVALLIILTFQLVNISKIRNKIEQQNKQIEQLQKEIDNFSKLPNEDYETILGENKWL